MLLDIVKRNRSYRRFYQDVEIEEKDLVDLIELARYSATGSNLQNLRFYLSWKPEKNAEIFSCLAWAGYLPKWPGPSEGERPTGYIVIVSDNEHNKAVQWNTGIAAQTMLLGATEKGLGGCMFGSINKPKLAELIDLNNRYSIELVIALGKPKEEVVIDDIIGDDVKYWRDEEKIHHVPKRKIEDLII